MGTLIVIDGTDGCGKHTQTKLLEQRLKDLGKEVYMVSFPCYESASSAAVRMYLNGEIGGNNRELNPYMCATFCAVDRVIQWETRLKELYHRENSIIICDRYISSNMLFQGSKFDSLSERERFFEWCYEFEVGKLGLPVDDITILLSLPIEVTQTLMSKRYHGDLSKRDIIEKDIAYLELCRKTGYEAYKHLSSIGYNWKYLDISQASQASQASQVSGIQSVEEIHNQIWEYVKEVVS